MNKIQAVRITLRRLEGTLAEIEAPKVITAETATGSIWEAANRTLMDWSQTAPADGGYDKCEFTVEYMNGQEYQGRYNLKHWTVEVPNLGRHIQARTTDYRQRFQDTYEIGVE
jgi:hypothetical protein